MGGFLDDDHDHDASTKYDNEPLLVVIVGYSARLSFSLFTTL